MSYTIQEKNKIIFFCAILVLVLYVSPFIILKENIPFLTHDNGDSNLVWATLLDQNNVMFGSLDSIVPQVMNGIPRNVFPSELNVISVLFSIFSPIDAYILNEIFIHFVAFLGMYLLLSHFFITKPEDQYIAIGTALAFAILPFWPFGGLSIAGLPLALYAFLNIRNGDLRYQNWLIICMIPFYSSLIASFFFFLIMMFLLYLYDVFVQKKGINLPFLCSLFLMGVLFCLVEYRLFYLTFFDNNFVSSRIEFGTTALQIPNCITIVGAFFFDVSDIFIFGQYHANSFHYYIIAPSILIALICISLVKLKINIEKNKLLPLVFLIITVIFLGFESIVPITRFGNFFPKTWFSLVFYAVYVVILISTCIIAFMVMSNRTNNKVSLKKFKSFINCEFNWNEKVFVFLILVCFAISLWFGLLYSPAAEYITLIVKYCLGGSFQLTRFHWLHPLLWYIIFALSLVIISSYLLKGKTLAGIFIIFQIVLLFTCVGISLGGMQVGGLGLIRYQSQMTFQEFYSPGLFNDIHSYINESPESYRIISIGIHPSVSQYNGFYTLDSYQANYPLDYKNQFRMIIANELGKNETTRKYFDDWGSRCYAFTNETGTYSMITKSSNRSIQHLDFNTTALKNMGGKYIFSAVEIKNYAENNLSYKKTFESAESPWKIWLYRVN